MRRRATGPPSTPAAGRSTLAPADSRPARVRIRSGAVALGPLDGVRELHPGRQPELVEDVAQVRLDGLGAEEEVGGDLRVGAAGGDQPGHLRLALGERAEQDTAGPAAGPVRDPDAEPAQLPLGLVPDTAARR